MALTGTLEKRGWVGKWQALSLSLEGKTLHVVGKSGKDKEAHVITSAKKLNSGQKGEEFAFTVYFEAGAKKKEDKWILRAKNHDQYAEWFDAIQRSLSSVEPQHDYGLPSTDPRTGLPIINIPAGYEETFRFLKIAVFHWFGVVKKLGSNVNGKFSVEERVLVLGDRCLYFCRKNADITRCILISNIKRLLLAQEDSQDLYVAIIMPDDISHTDKDGVTKETAEYDVMFHTPDIQTFVRYLRTVYQYQTNYQTLELDQVMSKEQLDRDVRLVKPPDWMLVYWPPMFKEVLAKLLKDFYEQNAEGREGAGNTLLGGGANSSGTGGAKPALMPPSAPAAAAPAEAPKTPPPAAAAKPAAVAIPAAAANAAAGSPPMVRAVKPARKVQIDEVPLGKYLVMIGFAKYFDILYDKNVDLDMLCGDLVDNNDLEFFGIENPVHREAILKGVSDKALIEDIRTAAMSPRAAAPQAKAAPKAAHADPVVAATDSFDLDDDLGLDLDDGPAGGGLGSVGFGGGGGLIDLDEFDLDLDVGSPAGAAGGDNISLDLDLDDDLGGPPAGGKGDDLDLDLDDL